MDLTILSSSTPPTFLTVIQGWLAVNICWALPMMPSSRPVKPLHMVIVTGVWSAAAVVGAEVVLPVLLPPQAARAAAASDAAAISGTILDFTVPPVRQPAGRG